MNQEQLKNAAAVMLAAAEGKPIEVSGRSTPRQWEPAFHTSWNWAYCEYRVAVTKPSINWEHVHPNYQWLTVDKDGTGCLHADEPGRDDDEGYWFSAQNNPTRTFASFIPGTCDWTESPVVRPGVE